MGNFSILLALFGCYMSPKWSLTTLSGDSPRKESLPIEQSAKETPLLGFLEPQRL